LDVILTDGERVQSMAISSDPDAVWFEPTLDFGSGYTGSAADDNSTSEAA
jgi:hypothetical protein